MRRLLKFLAIASRVATIVLAFSASSLATAGELLKVASRDGVRVSLFWESTQNATATVLLFPGGGGGFGQLIEGVPTSGNFLVRSYRHFIEAGFNVAIFGRPSDSENLDYADRITRDHLLDINAALDAIESRSKLPLWLIGTSRGTISTTHAAINLPANRVAGVVLTSSIFSRKKPGAITLQSVEKIRTPALLIHHKRDACIHCAPHEARYALSRFNASEKKELVLIDGGYSPSGDPCKGQHWHGFVNYERETIELVAKWILTATKVNDEPGK